MTLTSRVGDLRDRVLFLASSAFLLGGDIAFMLVPGVTHTPPPNDTFYVALGGVGFVLLAALIRDIRMLVSTLKGLDKIVRVAERSAARASESAPASE